MFSKTLWFHRKGYLQGIFWFCCVCFCSALNDTMVKCAGNRLSPLEISFFRFLFSTLTLLPFMLARGKQAFVTRHIGAHAIRGTLLFLAVIPWCYGVVALPLTLATTISFTTPLFVLIFAAIFLKEKVGWQRSFATLIGFLGILLSFQPSLEGFNTTAIFLVASTVMFATLDIINKKLLNADEGFLPMLFYSALGTTLLSLPLGILNWTTPLLNEFLCLFVLGAGANLLLFCLLKAIAACDISALQPLRYTELVFSGSLGFILFQEIPNASTLLGAACIIPSTLYIACYETRQQRLKKLETVSA
ncbi:MAG: DMT family transporter [Alphaproteobacteria bacterium]